MSSVPAVVGHVVFDGVLGWALLGLYLRARPGGAHLPAAFLLGTYAETLVVGTVVLLGVPLARATAATCVGAGAVALGAWRCGVLRPRSVVLPVPKWYEWLVLLSVAEKVAFAVWQLVRLPLYFDDASTHWSGRARALYGGVNWSLDPASPVWLGTRAGLGHGHYPLLAIVWRAETALVNGGWDDLLARADGLLFLLAIVATVWWAVWDCARARWFAALAAFVVAAVPLLVWHAAAGYSDIAVAAFAVGALAALLRREWGLAGALAAGAAWSKNDGLVLFMPALFVAVCSMPFPRHADRWLALARFLLGCATLAPWLVLRTVLGLRVSPDDNKLDWHPDVFELFWEFVVTGPTGSILWAGVAFAVTVCGPALWRDPTGRALLAALLLCGAALVFVFGCTDAYRWLQNEMTIHRTMLQLAPAAVVIAFYGVWLRIRPRAAGPARDESSAPGAVTSPVRADT